MEKELKEMKCEMKLLAKSNKRLLKNVNQLKLESTYNSNKIIKLESQLDTIKIRDGIKAFIDYIFVSLNLEGKIGYERKIYMIYNILDKKINNDNRPLIKNIKFIIYNVFKKLHLGNGLAHDINLNRSFIEQMFELIKDKANEDRLEETKLEFKKTNMEEIIKELIIVRKNNYNKAEDVKEREEQIVMSKVKDLDLILKSH